MNTHFRQPLIFPIFSSFGWSVGRMRPVRWCSVKCAVSRGSTDSWLRADLQPISCILYSITTWVGFGGWRTKHKQEKRNLLKSERCYKKIIYRTIKYSPCFGPNKGQTWTSLGINSSLWWRTWTSPLTRCSVNNSSNHLGLQLPAPRHQPCDYLPPGKPGSGTLVFRGTNDNV